MSDLPAEIPAYGALALAAFTLYWSERRFRSLRRARRAAGPATDIREALEAARQDFDDIVSVGGESTRFFLDEGRRASGQHLHDLSDRAGDPILSAALLEVSIAWNNCWAYASPPRGARMVNLEAAPSETPAEADRRRKNVLQGEVAREGRDKCQEAISRLNELERHIA
jgi:hypothetical protein